MSVKDSTLQLLDEQIELGKSLVGSFVTAQFGSLETSIPEYDLQAFAASALADIERIAGIDSSFYRAVNPESRPASLKSPGYDTVFLDSIIGSLSALKRAVSAGFLESLESQLRATIHDDILLQANELLGNNYHVAAMVLIGGVLEDHLRKLVDNRSLSIQGAPGLSKYNDALKGGAYLQTTWRRIQSITDIRNDAAHGHPERVHKLDVEDASGFTKRFIADYPT